MAVDRSRTDPGPADDPDPDPEGAELRALRAATEALREERLEVPESLDRRVMNAVRAELRMGALVPLGDPRTDLWVAESVVSRVLREAADATGTVRARSCRVRPGPGRSRRPTVVIILAIGYGTNIPAEADRVRRRLVRAARDRLGLSLGRIDVEVVDVIETWSAA